MQSTGQLRHVSPAAALQMLSPQPWHVPLTQLDQVALDKYSFVRDAYLARRLDALYDGAPPMEKFEDYGADDAPKPAAKPAPPAK